MLRHSRLPLHLPLLSSPSTSAAGPPDSYVRRVGCCKHCWSGKAPGKKDGRENVNFEIINWGNVGGGRENGIWNGQLHIPSFSTHNLPTYIVQWRVNGVTAWRKNILFLYACRLFFNHTLRLDLFPTVDSFWNIFPFASTLSCTYCTPCARLLVCGMF